MSSKAIGIFDSGVGGLTVLNAISDLLPHENLIYLADNLHTPYGGRSNQFISERVDKIAAFLVAQDVKALVVACNTATAAAVQSLRERYDVPIIGMEPALKPAVEFSPTETVGVLATQSTLESQKYQALKLKLLTREESIIERPSSLFVELVESGLPISKQETELITNELTPFIEAGVSSLVLGCTHYPFLTEVIAQIMGPNVRLFESGQPVAKELKRRIEGYLNLSEKIGTTVFYSSAPQRSQATFDRLLARPIELLPFQA